MALAAVENFERVRGKRVDKFAERRVELAEAALATLAELGYARTSLREIAQNSEFSHGVLHYYFSDKADLITCCVRLYKARCITRYDQVVAEAGSYPELLEGFLDVFAATLRDEGHLHRLWYDLRSQAMYDSEFRADISEIDAGLEDMIWRVMVRLGELAGVSPGMPRSLLYAIFDGLFQQCLLRHLSGDTEAITAMRRDARVILDKLYQPVG